MSMSHRLYSVAIRKHEGCLHSVMTADMTN